MVAKLLDLLRGAVENDSVECRIEGNCLGCFACARKSDGFGRGEIRYHDNEDVDIHPQQCQLPRRGRHGTPSLWQKYRTEGSIKGLKVRRNSRLTYLVDLVGSL